MVRYRLSATAPDSQHKIALALTDYLDVAQIIKTAIEHEHPKYFVNIVDLSDSPFFFKDKGDLFNGSAD